MKSIVEFDPGPGPDPAFDAWSTRTWPPDALLHRALRSPGRPWQRVARLAASQHGVTSLAQLLALGLSRSTVTRSCNAGHLSRMQPGVFAVGHRGLSRRGVVMAAILACGRGALASHLDAAAAHQIWTGERSVVDVSVPRSTGPAAKRGVVVHRCAKLTAADIEVRDQMALTALPRTLLDIATVLDPDALREAVGVAQRRGRLRVAALESLLERAGRTRGVAVLASLTAELRSYGGLPRRELERRFLALCRRHGLPRPEINGLVQVEGRALQVDFHWPEPRLVVETDGYAWHSDLGTHNEDRRRDQDLKLARWEVIRFSWSQIVEHPARVAKVVTKLMAERAESIAGFGSGPGSNTALDPTQAGGK